MNKKDLLHSLANFSAEPGNSVRINYDSEQPANLRISTKHSRCRLTCPHCGIIFQGNLATNGDYFIPYHSQKHSFGYCRGSGLRAGEVNAFCPYCETNRAARINKADKGYAKLISHKLHPIDKIECPGTNLNVSFNFGNYP